MADGIVPISERLEMLKDFRFDIDHIADGTLPVTYGDVANERYVSELRLPMLEGSDPDMEVVSKFKY